MATETRCVQTVTYRRTVATVCFAGFWFFTTSYASITVLPLYAVSLGAAPGLAGLQNGVFFLTGVILRFYLGPLADRHGRKPLLLFGSLVSVSAPLAFAFSGSFVLLVFARAYHGIALGAFVSAAGSLVSDSAPAQRRGLYIGVYRLALAAALPAGPLMAEFFISTHGFRGWFLINAAAHAFVLPPLLFMKTPPFSRSPDIHSFLAYRRLMVNSVVFGVLACVAVLAAAYSAVAAYLPLLDIGVENHVSHFFWIAGLVGFPATVLSGVIADRLPPRHIVRVMVGIAAVGVLLLGIPTASRSISLFLLAGSALLLGAAFSAGIAATMIWLVSLVPQEQHATVLTLQENTIDTFMAAGPILLGMFLTTATTPDSFLLLGLVLCVAAVLLVRHTRSTV